LPNRTQAQGDPTLLRFPSKQPEALDDLPPPLLAVVRRELDRFEQTARRCGQAYRPERDGQVYLLQRGDDDASVAAELGRPLAELPFEEVRFDRGGWCYVCLLLGNNEAMHAVIVPDRTWLDRAARRALRAQTEGGSS
jgi:hypothetical protein